MGRHEIGDLLEPPRGQLVEDLTAVRHGSEHMIERGDPIGGDQRERFTEVDDVTHLPDDQGAELAHRLGVDAGEGVLQCWRQIETHRAAATKASNSGRPEPP